MSRSSSAKKARRKRRLGARNEAWLPADVHADVEGVARIADVIVPRGWEFDHDFSDGELVAWYYAPSANDVVDESIEAVTRIWLRDPEEPHVILVGSSEQDHDLALTVEGLFEQLPEIEAYRTG